MGTTLLVWWVTYEVAKEEWRKYCERREAARKG